MRNKLKRFVATHFAPYMVMSNWTGKTTVHYAWTMDDAMDWMRQYPAACQVAVFNCLTEDARVRVGK